MTGMDQARVGELVERMLGAMTGACTVLMTHLGDRLGLYRDLAWQGPATAAELAARTGCAGRYLAEWLAQQAAVGILDHDPGTGRFTLPPEHAFVLAVEESPAAFAGGIENVAALFADLDAVEAAFRSGAGISWADHDERVYSGATRFFGAAYRASLVADWVPALGLDAALQRGARVADVGCGGAVSTVLLAEAYPRSSFAGFDTHPPSVEAARKLAADAGVGDRARFEVAGATGYGGGPYDVIWFFGCLHDLGDPVAAAAHARAQLAPGGTVAIVEPFALDEPAENIAANPGAGLAYTMSTMLCVPHSVSEPGRAALGAQAGGRVLREVLHAAGLSRVERVATTPANAVYAARP